MSLLGRNVREARITLELAMGMERELRRAVRSLEQRLQGMEESIEGLAEGKPEQGEEQGVVAEEQEEVREGSFRHLRHSKGGKKHKPFSPWAGK